MDSRIEAIKDHIRKAAEGLDRLMAGKSVEVGFVIERSISTLEDFNRDEMSIIEGLL